MERAASLLREDRTNVNEAARAVGYRNMSYFAEAFKEAFGCCAEQYPPTREPAETVTHVERHPASPVSLARIFAGSLAR